MNFYRTKMLVNVEINKQIKELITSKNKLKISSYILELTSQYPIGEKYVEHRIIAVASEYPELLKIHEGYIEVKSYE